jgi:lipopolysaccharide transport system ATP-binding protein
MSRAEVIRKFDDIVDFAGVGQFIDTAVRFYSSGMYMRLAFAVAAHLESEILVVDEALAVGDTEFQKRCLGKMDDISSREGRTILFVSHNLEAVQRLCSRGLLLRRGRLEADGPIGEVVAQYRAVSAEHADGFGHFNPAVRRGIGWARFTDIRVMSGGARVGRVTSDDDLEVEIDLAVAAHHTGTLRGLVVELVVHSDGGVPLCSLMNVDGDGDGLPDDMSCTVRVRIPGPTFVPGTYRLSAFVGLPFLQQVDEVDDAVEFEVLPPRQPWRPYELVPSRGHVCRLGEWNVVRSGGGRPVAEESLPLAARAAR